MRFDITAIIVHEAIKFAVTMNATADGLPAGWGRAGVRSVGESAECAECADIGWRAVGALANHVRSRCERCMRCICVTALIRSCFPYWVCTCELVPPPSRFCFTNRLRLYPQPAVPSSSEFQGSHLICHQISASYTSFNYAS
jgi:hypothetical protein